MSAIALLVAEVVAVGIFLTAGRMAIVLPGVSWILAVWCGMSLMALCGALCYGQLASRYPTAGGLYVYTKEIWGPAAAFLYGWMSLFVVDPGITAALAVGAGEYAVLLGPLNSLHPVVVAVLLIFLLAFTSLIGTQRASAFLVIIAGLKVGLLLFGTVAAAFLGDPENILSWSSPAALSSSQYSLTAALAVALVAAYFSFGGWWDLTKMTEEIQNPKGLVRRALVIGVALVATLYILLTLAFLYVVPFQPNMDGEAFLGVMARNMFGENGETLLSSLVLLSIIGTLAALLVACPRVYFAMSRDGLFFKSVASVHPRLGTPVRAILLQAGLAILMVVSGSFEEITGYFIFVANLFVALPVLGLIYRSGHGRDWPGKRYLVSAVVFITGAAILLFVIAFEHPFRSFLGCAVVALGLPFYWRFLAADRFSGW
ncbi:MAG TPA: amino acid permease [Acidobacteriota bacterium]|nr:amino acid permease [Acidobacteriota bacterium]